MIHENENRMQALLERLKRVMDLSTPNVELSESINPPQAYSNFTASNDSNCTGWDCFSKLNDVKTDELSNKTGCNNQRRLIMILPATIYLFQI